MFGLGFGELVLIFLIALIFIGPKKLPELAKGLGKGIREFQNAAKGFSDQMQDSSSAQEMTQNKITDASQQRDAESTAPTSEKKDSTHS
jgi:sec-independent protein translocase protein TatA